MNNKTYGDNLIAGKIRRLLDKDPNAGYSELYRVFGYMNRSIRVTYYRIYQRMFNKSGSLRQKIIRSAPIRDKVLKYFKEHPDHTIVDGAHALDMSEKRVYNTLYNASVNGFKVTFKKRLPYNDKSYANQIRNYMKKHPKATSKECAKAIGIDTSYVSLVQYRDRKNAKTVQ